MWDIKTWVNNNDGEAVAIIIFLVTVFVVTPIGFFIKKKFFSNKRKTVSQRQKGGKNSENYQAGRDIDIHK